MTNRAQELIKAFYEEEALRKETEITFSDYSLRLNTSDIAMLEIIAKRFGKTAERIASEAVAAAVYSMVEAIETTERKQMAKEADELNESLSKKAAKVNGRQDFEEKSVTWVMNDRAITREENRRKKESDEQTPTSESKLNQNIVEDNAEDIAVKEATDQNDVAEPQIDNNSATTNPTESVFAS